MKFFAVIFLAGMATAHHKYVNMKSDEIDSEEHGVLPGKKATTCKCGWANRVTSRIVGGQETGINQFPWVAGIAKKKGFMFFCGGTIISEYHVLTAAHCTYQLAPNTIQVRVGEHDVTSAHETDATKTINVKSIKEHENYDPEDDLNDIALLELENKISFSDKVVIKDINPGPACLPFQRNAFNLVNKYIKVLGWGRTETNGQPSFSLLHTNLRVIPLDICKTSFKGTLIDTDTPKQICTYSNGRDACQGDSGGPVVYLDPETNRYTLVGVVSYGADCASETPAINTEVAAYLDWIQKNMQSTNSAGKKCMKV